MATFTYRGKDLVVTVANAPLEGYGPDAIAKFTPNSESFGLVVGVDGQGTRFATGDTSGRVAVTLAQSSLSNDVLTTLHQTDLNAPNGAGIAPLNVLDTSGRSKLLALEAWIVGWPEMGFSKGVETRIWTFEFTEALIVVAGN